MRPAAQFGDRGSFHQALADCNEAIRLDPKEPLGYERRAWIWATSSDARFRDGKRAVESATRSCELTDWSRAANLATLAAACAKPGISTLRWSGRRRLLP